MKDESAILAPIALIGIFTTGIITAAIVNTVILFLSQESKPNKVELMDKKQLDEIDKELSDSFSNSLNSDGLSSDEFNSRSALDPAENRTLESFESANKILELDKLSKSSTGFEDEPKYFVAHDIDFRINPYPKGVTFEVQDSNGNRLMPLDIEPHGIYLRGNVFMEDGLELNTSLRLLNAKLNYLEQRLKMCEERN